MNSHLKNIYTIFTLNTRIPKCLTSTWLAKKFEKVYYWLPVYVSNVLQHLICVHTVCSGLSVPILRITMVMHKIMLTTKANILKLAKSSVTHFNFPSTCSLLNIDFNWLFGSREEVQ